MKSWSKKFNALMVLSTLLISQPMNLAWAGGPNPLQPFEQGPNDFIVSRVGFPGTGANAQAGNTAVAFDRIANRFLNVWDAKGDTVLGAGSNEREIYGTLSKQDNDTTPGGISRLTQVGPANDPNFIANAPDIAANPRENQNFSSFVLVYEVTDEAKGGVGVFDIFAQKLDSTGGLVGNPIRVSDMDDTPATDTVNIPPSDRAAQDPAIAFNSDSFFSSKQEYLVVWSGKQNGKFDIFGQRLSANASPIGSNFRISTTALAGNISTNPNFNAVKPRVVFNTDREEYLVVWSQDTEGLTDDEFEIWGRRLSDTGQFLTDPFRISSMGPDGNTSFAALSPDIAYNINDNLFDSNTDPNNDEYLVVWSGNEQASDFEIYGQRLDALGNEIGTDDFRISDMGPDAPDPLSNEFPATNPAVECNPTADTYYVVWSGEDDRAPLVNDEREIFGQLLDENGNELANNDVRISDMGDDGSVAAGVLSPAIAVSPLATTNLFLVNWAGDDIGKDNGFGQNAVDDEIEVFNQIILAKEGLLQISHNQISIANPQDVCFTFKLTAPDASGEPDLAGPTDKTLFYLLGIGTKTSPETIFQPTPAMPNLPNNGIVRLPINSPLAPDDPIFDLFTSLFANNATVGTLGSHFTITLELSTISPALLAPFKNVTWSFAMLGFEFESPPNQQAVFVPDPNTTTNAVSFTIVD